MYGPRWQLVLGLVVSGIAYAGATAMLVYAIRTRDWHNAHVWVALMSWLVPMGVFGTMVAVRDAVQDRDSELTQSAVAIAWAAVVYLVFFVIFPPHPGP